MREKINHCGARFQVETESQNNNAFRTRSQLDVYEDYTSLKAADLKLRIDEMIRIKVVDSCRLKRQ